MKSETSLIGTKIVYFKNEWEDCVMRHVPDVGFYVKFKGKPEFLQHGRSYMIADTMRQKNAGITKEEYNNF